MKVIKSILLVLLLSCISFPQLPTNWKNYTDMKKVVSIQALRDGIWAASNGGAFFYNTSNSEYKTLLKTDDLFSTSLTAVCVDNEGKVWLGGSDGSLNVFNPSQNIIRNILDIHNSDFVNRQINELAVFGDTIFISSQFGLSLVNFSSLEFLDTYFKFGNLPSNIKVVSTLKHGLIYVCTESGIAIQKPGAVNLSAPESWDIFTTVNGLPSNVIRKLVLFGDSIIAATDKGLAKFNGVNWQTYLPSFNNVNVLDLLVKKDSLIISHGGSISIYYQGILNTIFSSSIGINKLSISNLGIFATSPKGIIKIEGDTTYTALYPNGPEANQFPSISVDNNGKLWCASGKDNRGVGFYSYDGNLWTTTNSSNAPLPYNDYHLTYCSPDNTAYIGSWGFGFARIRNNKLDIFQHSNLPIQGIQENLAFIVTTGFANDSKGNLWILTYAAADRKLLAMLTQDSTWYTFAIPAESNQYFRQHFNLAIDQYDTKWFCSQDPGKTGLLYFNENKTPNNINDDYSGFLTKNNGLNDNTINCIVTDKRGDIWVGTSLGVNVITNSNSVLSSNPSVKISSVFSLRQQTINCIAVDPLNQKWIGTNQGLLLVNSDGSKLLATYNSKNSPLLDDVIRSLAIDENKGRVYVGTDAGLISFETPAIKPVETFSDLFIFPNPFKLNNNSEFLTIDGLVKDADIKIININGKLVNQFSSFGGRVAYWDGKDTNGNLVNSGIYIIVAYDKDGNNVAKSKLAVIRNK